MHVSPFICLYMRIYSTAQMQLHMHAYILVCQHACVNMLPVMCDGILVSLTYCARMLHEGLHTRMCYSSGYKLATRVYVLLACTTVHVIIIFYY